MHLQLQNIMKEVMSLKIRKIKVLIFALIHAYVNSSFRVAAHNA